MRLTALHAFAAIALIVPAHADTELLVSQPQSKLWVEGTSSMKNFSCKAAEFTLTVKADGSGAVAAVLAGQKAVSSLELTIPSAKLDCSNGTMNEHMRKAIKLDENKVIEFTMASYDVNKGTDGVAGTLTGTLKLGGVTKTITIPATAKPENGALHVVGGYELKMSDFDLTPPSLMFGRIKVRDDLNVKFDLLLKI